MSDPKPADIVITPATSTEADNAKATTEVTHPADATPQPLPNAGAPSPAAADTGHGTQHRQQVSAANQAPEMQWNRYQRPQRLHRDLASRGLRESDAAINQNVPQLGDSVRVDIDRVPITEQREIHHRVRASGVHAKVGTVIGSEVQGGMHLLRIETDSGNMLVPAEAVDWAEPVVGPEQRHPAAISPEKMRKPRDGAYNKT
jgi:hypothetical protein